MNLVFAMVSPTQHNDSEILPCGFVYLSVAPPPPPFFTAGWWSSYGFATVLFTHSPAKVIQVISSSQLSQQLLWMFIDKFL